MPLGEDDTPVIEFNDVNKWFGSLHVLKDINLTIGAGEVVVVCGPSGSGKSTLIRCINRLELIQSGEIIVDGLSLSAAGFDVTLASDGVEGHARYVEHGADVVVTDIQMPRMDGFAFTRAVKSESGGRVPVVLVTGRESVADRRAGLEAGADAYVVKSTFEESDLIETVRRFL